MEHREPPRIAPGDRRFDGAIEELGGRFGLRILDEARKRRSIDYRRLGLLFLAGLATVGGLFYLGSRATRAAVAWLAHQSQYQIPFHQIELVHSPPEWFRGGSRSFLEGVRKSAGEPENVAVLLVPPDRLALEFKKYAWVEKARVIYAPRQIRVDLQIRQPVARAQLGGGGQIVFDANAIILPQEDIDLAVLGRVIWVTGHDLLAPSDPRPGLIWKSAADASGLDRGDERVLAAAKLAGFLVQEPRQSDSERSAALRILEIIVTDFGQRGLFAMNAEGAAICWGDAPGDEKAEKPSAHEKWAMLRSWAETSRARFLVDGDYWAFGENGVRHVCPQVHQKAPHRPLENSERPGGQTAAPAKRPASG